MNTCVAIPSPNKTCYAVACPQESGGPKRSVVDFGRLQISDLLNVRLRVDGLSGCMGTICVAFDRKPPRKATYAMLMHDNASGYFQTRNSLVEFMGSHPGADFGIAWGFGVMAEHHEDVGGWIQSPNRFSLKSYRRNVTLFCCKPLYPESRGAYGYELPECCENDCNPVYHGENLPVKPSLNELDKNSPQWVPDTDTCQVCAAVITRGFITTGRHHCRNCGKCICDKCIREGVSKNMKKLKYCKNCNPAGWTDAS